MGERMRVQSSSRVLVVVGGLVALCSLGSDCQTQTGPPPDCTQWSTAQTAKFVVSSIQLPHARTDSSIDLNGDGKTDNQLATIVSVLSGHSLDLQRAIDPAITPDGNLLLLVAVQDDDATFQAASCAGASVGQATPTPSPDLSGHGTFVAAGIPAQTVGPLTSGAYDSNDPATTTHPVLLDLSLALVSGAAPVELPLVGAHLSMQVSASGLMTGELQGAIRITDLQDMVLPAVAAMLNQQVTNDPSGAGSQAILQQFDSNGDGSISLSEVTGGILQNVLTADVQMFDPAGNFHPDPSDTSKDSLSIAFGFTAVPASF